MRTGALAPLQLRALDDTAASMASRKLKGPGLRPIGCNAVTPDHASRGPTGHREGNDRILDAVRL
jgi:hypothetical protein